jgi:hypothetical protein
MEVMLRVLKYALTSKYPIVDPVSKTCNENITEDEKDRPNQIAIHFLTTSRAFNVEGKQVLWGNNTFVFTTPQAVLNFSLLPLEFRQNVKQVTFRVIAQYYDDVKRQHYLNRYYHPDVKRRIRLRTMQRPNDRLERGGFRCYSWMQIVDFFAALRAPYDPRHDRKKPRPRLLPNLESLTIHCVNFDDDLGTWPTEELHNMATHEFGYTLDELFVSGLPSDPSGHKISAELTGLLKDEGVFFHQFPFYVQLNQGGLKSFAPWKWCKRVVRCYKTLLKSTDVKKQEEEAQVGIDETEAAKAAKAVATGLDSADTESSFTSITSSESDEFWYELLHDPKWQPKDTESTIWKYVPAEGADIDVRMWVEFCRETGYEVPPGHDSDHSDTGSCPDCGVFHPGSSYLDMLSDDGP